MEHLTLVSNYIPAPYTTHQACVEKVTGQCQSQVMNKLVSHRREDSTVSELGVLLSQKVSLFQPC